MIEPEVVTRSTELIIICKCGCDISHILSQNLKEINEKSPEIIKCPGCNEDMKITEILDL
jgi:hypothetical protein